jgi:hypothetical protein
MWLSDAGPEGYTYGNMASHERIVELSTRVQVLSHEIEQRQQELTKVMDELTAATRAIGGGRPKEVSQPLAATSRVQARAKKGRKTRSDHENAMPARITQFLAENSRESFTPRQLADRMQIEDERRNSLQVTLYRLVKEGRVRRDDTGYRTALGAEPVVRKASQVQANS